IGRDHQSASGQPVEQRPDRDAYENRREENGDEQRADPRPGVGAVLDRDRQRNRCEPGSEQRTERREEQQPEACVAAKELEVAHGSAYFGAAVTTLSRASARNAFSSDVPTVTLIAVSEPNALSGRTITPSRSSASKTMRASPPVLASAAACAADVTSKARRTFPISVTTSGGAIP